MAAGMPFPTKNAKIPPKSNNQRIMKPTQASGTGGNQLQKMAKNRLRSMNTGAK